MRGKLNGHNTGNATFTADDGTVIELFKLTPTIESGRYFAFDGDGKEYEVEDYEDECVLSDLNG